MDDSPKMYGVKNSNPDKDGKVQFDLFWRGNRNRAQCFRANPNNYPDVEWVKDEAEAKKKAWGEHANS